MSLPSFSVKNQVLVNMMMWVVLIGGGLMGLSLVREMFPESRPDKIAVMAIYPAVQPAEIEKAVTIKIEEAVRDVEGVEKIYSTVSEGVSSTRIHLLNEVEDVDAVLQEIKSKIDSIQDLPDDLEQITVTKMEPKLPVIAVALYGPGDEADRKRAAQKVRDDLLLLPGVSNVTLSGIREDEISVEIIPDQLVRYNVTFDQVAQAIRNSNLDISGGELKGNRITSSVRIVGEENRAIDLEDIIVMSNPDGSKVFLSDVARVTDGFIESDLESYFNGEPSVNCTVFKTESQDAIQIATLVKAYVAGKTGEEFDPFGIDKAYEEPWYWKPFSLTGAYLDLLINKISGRPDPVKFYEASRQNPFDHTYKVKLHTDLSRFVSGRLDLMTRNGKSGLILVLVSLYLFLNRRVAFWSAVGLPVSFLGTFLVMAFFGVTINLLSMFGLIIVLGIIVDDAIVIGENIYRNVEEGMEPKEAAVKGAEEVMWPVIIAVATTIAAFAPLLFIKGQIGDFMGQLPLVVLSALSVSLLEALVVLPAHLSHLPSREEMLARKNRPPRFGILSRIFRKAGGFQDWFMKAFLMRWYDAILRTALKWRYVTLTVAMATLIISFGLFAGGIVESVFIQSMDAESIIGALEMPVGTTSKNVQDRLQILTKTATDLPEIDNVQVIVARQYDMTGAGAIGNNDASHLGQLVIELKAADERERLGMRSSNEVLQVLRNKSRELSGVNSVTWESMSGGPGGKDIEIQVTGPRFEEVIAVSDELKAKLETYEGVFDLDDDYEEGQREVQLRLRQAAEPTGITVMALGQHVRSALYGREARRLTRNREDVKIMVRYPEEYRTNIYNLENMWIPSGTQPLERGWVPLKEVAEVEEAISFSSIHRSQRERSVTVFGEVDDELGNTSEIMSRVRQDFETEILPQHPEIRIEFLGSMEEQSKAFSSLKLAFPVALLLIYMLLAGLFRSYAQPVVVMSAIPFGLQGAIVGHWVTGNPMTILSWIGVVALTGIVVNDSLVLVDFINTRIRSGMTHFEASLEGAKLRLRAILLTTLTTVSGLLPLMFETSFQAKFLIPMAVTLTFGLMFATALTLIIVPTLNMIFYDVRYLMIGYTEEETPESELKPEPTAV